MDMMRDYEIRLYEANEQIKILQAKIIDLDNSVRSLRETAEMYRKNATDARADLLVSGISGKLMSGSEKYKRLYDAYREKAAECERWKKAYVDVARAAFSSIKE